MGSKRITLIALAVAQFMVILDVTIVNVALPHIQASLAFSADGLQWVVSAYTLAFGGFLLLGGRAADLLAGEPCFSSVSPSSASDPWLPDSPPPPGR
jgi:MFS family permease